MNGWIALAIYVGVDLTLTIGLFIYKKKRAKKLIQELDIPKWVNSFQNDIDDKFNNIVGRLNHPTYREQ